MQQRSALQVQGKSPLHGFSHSFCSSRKHVTAEWSLSSLFSLRFKEVAQVFEVFNHMPLLFRCIGSSSTISITGEMGNDEWTVITLQLTDAFLSPSLFVFNGGLWRNGCSAAFMSGADGCLSCTVYCHKTLPQHCSSCLEWCFPYRTEGGIVIPDISFRSYRCIGKSTFLVKLLNVLPYFLHAVFAHINSKKWRRSLRFSIICPCFSDALEAAALSPSLVKWEMMSGQSSLCSSLMHFAAHLFLSLMVVSGGMVAVQPSCPGQVNSFPLALRWVPFLHSLLPQNTATTLFFLVTFSLNVYVTCVAAWNGVFPIALKVALLYWASPSALIGVLASPHFSLSS
uniref:Uncharacterized protein n=1 Tax=Magallana gigas TaxID=29159 RepID=K1QP28_MAGGI